jgi:ribosomal-protein-alanine N-acetyltransferase
MRFSFRPLTHADVDAMVAWRYDPPYEEYDPGRYPADVEEMRAAVGDPTWFAADDADTDDFVGFVDARPAATAAEVEVEVGLGLRPDRTGRGIGPAFVEAIVDLVRARWHPERITLDVLPWNERAMAAYAKVGFVRGETYDKTFEDGNVVTFVRMTRTLG